MRNTIHQISNRIEFLELLRKYLKPEGRISIIDHNGESRIKANKPLLKHQTKTEDLIQELETAQYVIQDNYDFIPNSSFLIATIR